MKIWHGEESFPMDGYSIAENLLFAIVAETPERELSAFEKLFVVLNSSVPTHQGYLTDVYMACGCFEKAKEFYVANGHERKLGDICWILGELSPAEVHYLNTNRGAQPYRKQPDYDRLIRLAFVQERWDEVVRYFSETPFCAGTVPHRVICGGLETSAKPYLEMLAVALNALAMETGAPITSTLQSAFRLSPKSWREFRSDPVWMKKTTIGKISRRCPPRPGKNPPILVDEALSLGSTPRASKVLSYVQQCDSLLTNAQDCLERFGKKGDDADLITFIELVTRSGITAVSHSFLFSAMGHDSFGRVSIPPERMAKLYSAHPIMNKRHFGKLLQIKFENRIALTGADIVIGLFQQAGTFAAFSQKDSGQDIFAFARLAKFRDWAEIRLDDWLAGKGGQIAGKVAQVWRKGDSKSARHTFGGETLRPPETPRNSSEWAQFLNVAARWLRRQWNRDIGTTPWISENLLYQLLKRRLKGFQVLQHAQPTWISPQHLDVFIPEAALAVEYMGEQHYRPLEFFGGEFGFQAVKERDARKCKECLTHNVELHFVRYDEDLGTRVDELLRRIRERHAANAEKRSTRLKE